MKMCERHWGMLRAAIDRRGLTGLVAKSGEQACSNVAADLQGTKNPRATFDPLMDAHFAIVNQVMGRVGLAVMAPNDDGSERCPLCFIQETHDKECQDPRCGSFDKWIDCASDDSLARAKELGLVAGA